MPSLGKEISGFGQGILCYPHSSLCAYVCFYVKICREIILSLQKSAMCVLTGKECQGFWIVENLVVTPCQT